MRKFVAYLFELFVLVAAVSAAGWVANQFQPNVVHVHNHESQIVSAIPEVVMDASIYVQNADGCGSGVLFTKGDVSFVWTAAHVMRIDPPAPNGPAGMLGLLNPDLMPLPEVLTTATVTQRLYRNGKIISEHKAAAELIAYSAEYDLALLEVSVRGFTKATTEFYEDETLPRLGTEVYHVGNYHCDALFSLTDGVIAQHHEHQDQTTAVIFPGSSGGGIFLKDDGRCLGIVQTYKHPVVSYFCPTRRMREWARSAGIEWAMTRSLPTPADRTSFLKLNL